MYKAIAILVLVTVILGGIYAAISSYGANKFQAGIDHQIAKQKNADDEAESAAIGELKEKIRTINQEKIKWREKALRLSEEVEEIDPEETVTTCTDRGPDYVRMWNEYSEAFLQGVNIISE